jgi:hypothetical protein
LSAACGASEATRSSAPQYPRGVLDRTCKFVGLESVEGPTDQNADAVTLLAVYRFGEPGVPAPKQPVSLKFQVNRSRVNDLRSHLEAHPEVICSPEAGTHNYAARVAPFGDIRGQPQP